MNEYIYLLMHTYEYGEKLEKKETKVLGIYTSREKAEKAISRFILLPGFRNYSRDCFIVEEYLLNEDMYWAQGFVKWEEAKEDFYHYLQDTM